ncbi:hypothetical protein JCM15765_20340 [Paradesulfitobacterium aromaticivorans]
MRRAGNCGAAIRAAHINVDKKRSPVSGKSLGLAKGTKPDSPSGLYAVLPAEWIILAGDVLSYSCVSEFDNHRGAYFDIAEKFFNVIIVHPDAPFGNGFPDT